MRWHLVLENLTAWSQSYCKWTFVGSCCQWWLLHS